MSVVLVTGCSSGFGLETAVGFAKRGDTVVATMRDLDRDGPLRARLAEEQVSAEMRQLDVVNASSRTSLVEGVLRDFGAIDVLINNAGVSQLGPAEEIDEEFHRTLFETNYWGPFELMRLALPSMRKRRAGRIVNLTSTGAIDCVPWMGVYCASKHALDAVGAAMDNELKGFGVRVVGVLPGPYGTALARNMPDDPQSTGYGDYFTAGREYFDKLLHRRSDTSPVVEAVIDAATDPEPPPRTLVGVTRPGTADIGAAMNILHAELRG